MNFSIFWLRWNTFIFLAILDRAPFPLDPHVGPELSAKQWKHAELTTQNTLKPTKYIYLPAMIFLSYYHSLIMPNTRVAFPYNLIMSQIIK